MTAVKNFNSSMAGAPVLNSLTSQAGSLIGVLDACLVTGFGSKVIGNLVIAGGVATATVAGPHAFEPNVVISIAGSSGAANGLHTVSAVTPTTVSFPLAAPNQTIGSGGTVAVAPAGWAKTTGLGADAIYKSADPNSFGKALYVDDAYGNRSQAFVQGCEGFSDAATRTGKFPADGAYWTKSGDAAASINWELYADSRFFVLFMHVYENWRVGFSFGDFLPASPEDTHATILGGRRDPTPTISLAPHGSVGVSSLMSVWSLARPYNGLAQAQAGFVVAASRLGGEVSGVSVSGTSQVGMVGFPNLADNGLLTCSQFVLENNGSVNIARGQLPGIHFIPQNTNAQIVQRSILPGSGPTAGRKLQASTTGGLSVPQGSVLIDITGPWR